MKAILPVYHIKEGLPDGWTGRGSENKMPLIADSKTNNRGHRPYAIFSSVKSFCKEAAEVWAISALFCLKSGSCGRYKVFPGSEATCCFHHGEIVCRGRKNSGMECFNRVNTVLGNLKGFITGTNLCVLRE